MFLIQCFLKISEAFEGAQSQRGGWTSALGTRRCAENHLLACW